MWLVEVEGAGHVLAVNDVRQLGGREAQQVEHAVHGGMRAPGEWQHLQGDAGRPGGLDEAGELGAHNRGPGGGTAQDRLVDHHPQVWRVGAGQDLLAGHAQG
ncbi:MAG TPA: hypothetical protein VMV07_22835, partial [Streptosporangiaceae bacterium]|nr:hypothetical protein [Streptosporangiaceae bacterium]